MTVVLTICVAMLGIAAVLILVRIVRGPSTIDRAVAFEALVAVTVGALVIEAAANRHTTTLPVLVVLTLVGFVGSASLARFTPGRGKEERR